MIAFITDTHFGARNFRKNLFESMMLFFEQQFFPYLIEHGIKDVIHCGDIVHNRNMIDLWFNQEIKRRFMDFFEKNGINLHVIVGNHDIYYKTTIDYNYLTQNFREYKHIIVYEQQQKIKIGKYTFLMVPWVIDHHKFSFEETADICCGHFDMSGFRMTKTQFSEEGFDLRQFAQFKLVFSGHYHIKSEQKNVQYIGCPYPFTWNDYDEQHGFIVLKDDFKYKFVENAVNGKFIKVFYDEVGGVQTLQVGGLHHGKKLNKSKEEIVEIARSNYLRVITKNIQNQMLFDNFYASLLRVSRDNFPIEVIDGNEIIESFDGDLLAAIEREMEKNGNEDIITLFEMFVNSMTFEQDVDRKMLLNLFEKTRKEAQELGNMDDSL